MAMEATADVKPVGVALVGYGYWGPNLARNFHALASSDLRYVVDSNPQALAAPQRLFGCATSTDYAAVLADPAVVAIAIATPARTHFALAAAALRAGKHVLVEKPLTMDVGEAQTLIELAAARNLTLMVGHVFEYNPAVRYIRAAIQAGELGDIYYSLQPARESWPRAERHQRALEHRAPRHFDCALRAERAARSGALPGVALSQRPGGRCDLSDPLLPRQRHLPHSRQLAGSEQDA
jgi:predicted dehydrogenase